MGLLGLLLEPIPAASERGQATPWTSRQLIAGPSLMAEAAIQGANCMVIVEYYIFHQKVPSRSKSLLQERSSQHGR